MHDDTLAARFQFGHSLIREAGALALGYFRNLGALTIKSKGLQDMASEADVNTEILIRDRLKAAYPDDAFLGEETGMSAFASEQGIWVVDPIDGTQPFVSGLSNWCVSIGFVQGGIAQFGLVFAPARDELFAGGKHFRATLNGEPVARHPGQALSEGLVGLGYSTKLREEAFMPLMKELLDRDAVFYRDGSGAMMLSYVACGRLVGYIEPHINAWDCLGAIPIIEAAGLLINDFLGNDGLRKGNAIYAPSADGQKGQIQ